MTSTAGGGDLARRLRAMRRETQRTVTRPASMNEPDWTILERTVPPGRCAAFMWIGWAVRPAGPPIARYKHAITRRYLNLDEDGAAYRYVAAPDPAWCGSYVRIPLAYAVEDVFDGSTAADL